MNSWETIGQMSTQCGSMNSSTTARPLKLASESVSPFSSVNVKPGAGRFGTGARAIRWQEVLRRLPGCRRLECWRRHSLGPGVGLRHRRRVLQRALLPQELPGPGARSSSSWKAWTLVTRSHPAIISYRLHINPNQGRGIHIASPRTESGLTDLFQAHGLRVASLVDDERSPGAVERQLHQTEGTPEPPGNPGRFRSLMPVLGDAVRASQDCLHGPSRSFGWRRRPRRRHESG